MISTTPPVATVVLPGVPDTVDRDAVIGEMVRRAASAGFASWWGRVESVGFCAHPIQLTGTDEYGRDQVVWTRCNNRRTQVCPSCADLYARDTWQLVHAGTAGGHHDMPATIANRPQVFVTLTAPSFGAVHAAPSGKGRHEQVCRDPHRTGGYARCAHGKPLWCSNTHDSSDPRVGQPLCAECYDYAGHVLFTWYLPELWRRFTITLRRAVGRHLRAGGADPGAVRLSFVKVVELQARAIPHIHALIRCDPTAHHEDDSDGQGMRWVSPVSATDLAVVIQRAARTVTLTVDHNDETDGTVEGSARMIRFGPQVDTQPVTCEQSSINDAAARHDSPTTAPRPVSARRVAAYLAKYVTKSLADVGISARRLSPEAISELEVSEHVRAILTTITTLANHGLTSIGKWLHTLGYRGHITSKSRRYSTTMGALRAHRADWTRDQHANTIAAPHDPNHSYADDLVAWEFDRAGHTCLGDRTLVISAAYRHITARRTAREALRHQPNTAGGVPDG